MHGKPKVLIVDDEERFRNTLSRLLGMHHIPSKAVGSALDALAELGAASYDIVLLDVRMPGMSGVEALAEIKKINTNIEVIILTGHASVDVAVDIMRLGGYEYLLKPCDIDDLITKIDSAYERKLDREKRQQKDSTLNPQAS
jgi:DNA-binding NtrC family response regulator